MSKKLFQALIALLFVASTAAADMGVSTPLGGGGASDVFKTFSVDGQDDVVADSETDAITLVAGDSITITTNAAGDSITITATPSSAFNWTTSEQEYPLITHRGETVYAKIVECGAGPNNTTTSDAHGITNLDRIMPGTLSVWDDGTGQYFYYLSATTKAFFFVDDTNVKLYSDQDFSGYTVYAYLIYTKTGD